MSAAEPEPMRGQRRKGRAAPDGSRRMRAELRGLFGDPSVAARVEREIGALAGVVEVRASSVSGRVLVRLADPSVADGVIEALAALADPAAPLPPSVRRTLERWTSRARATLDELRDTGEASAPPRAERHAWHAIPIESVLASFRVDARAGLTEAGARRSLRAAGPNVLAGMKRRSRARILGGQLFTVPTALLAGAAGLSLALGDVLESVAITVVVGSNIVVGYFTESRAEELLDAWGKLRVEWGRVVREGQERKIRASEIVPGDVIVLRPGDPIPADARLAEADGLAVDESSLTGESEAVEKTIEPVFASAPLAERTGMVYAGTFVAEGTARAVVVETGQNTELGIIQRSLSRTGERVAPLERQLGQLGRRIAVLSLASAGGMVGLGLLRGRPLAALARSAVALGVAAIPEGFPAVGTTALALASQRLHRKGIIIRRLAAAETLGAVSVVCADKTGTLTENRMRVEELYLPGEGRVEVRFTAPGGGRPGRCELRHVRGEAVPHARVRDLARIAALNSDVEVSDAGQIMTGSGTERALVELAMGVGYPVVGHRRRARRIGEQRRAADRPFMVTTHEHPELGRIELVKGAPEEVVARCEMADDAQRAAALEQNDAMAARGLRVLALAWCQNGSSDHGPVHLAGLVGLRDPARAGVREALASLSRAGVRTLMLTGDQHRTALAIGEALGISSDDVYSRVAPEQKLDVIEELQRQGLVVAMTGDGVNDGPALKAADVGVAMGERGTDIARAVADVVLARDDLPSLAEAVVEGRRLYDNVRRAIDYLVATNMSEVMVMVGGAVIGISPLNPLQLLWLNLLTDVAPALALALEPADPDVMARPPRDPERPLFRGEDYRRLGRDAAWMATASLGAYSLGIVAGRGRARAGTLAFGSLITSQLLHALACRSHGAEKNALLGRALVGSFGLQALALGHGGFRRVLGNARLGPAELALAFGVGALPGLLDPARRILPAREEIVARATPPDAAQQAEEEASPPSRPRRRAAVRPRVRVRSRPSGGR